MRGTSQEKEKEQTQLWLYSCFHSSPLLYYLDFFIVRTLDHFAPASDHWLLHSNHLIGFIKDRICTVKLMVLRQRYQELSTEYQGHELHNYPQ